MHSGQDKEGNEITFMDVIESKEKNVEDALDLKFKVKKITQKLFIFLFLIQNLLII